jgi:hypothetical protein
MFGVFRMTAKQAIVKAQAPVAGPVKVVEG